MLEQFNNSFSNVLDFRGSYFNLSNREIYEMSKPQDIIRMTKSTANSIGFVPLKGYDYVTLINGFSKQNNSSTDLYFFYYDKTDLTDIYKIDEIK